MNKNLGFSLFIIFAATIGMICVSGFTMNFTVSTPASVTVTAVSTGTGTGTASYPSRTGLALELISSGLKQTAPSRLYDTGPSSYSVALYDAAMSGPPLTTANGSTSFDFTGVAGTFVVNATQPVIAAGSDMFLVFVAQTQAQTNVMLRAPDDSFLCYPYTSGNWWFSRGTSKAFNPSVYTGDRHVFMVASDGTTGSASAYVDGVQQGTEQSCGTGAVGAHFYCSYTTLGSNAWAGAVWSYRVYSRLPTVDERLAPASFWDH